MQGVFSHCVTQYKTRGLLKYLCADLWAYVFIVKV